MFCSDPNQQLPTKVQIIDTGKMTKAEAFKYVKEAMLRYDERRIIRKFTELA